jgi:hypothetical protein
MARRHPGPTSKLPGVDFNQKAYRGYLIRKNSLTGDMWIEKDGHLIGRVPASQSWAWAQKEIDALLDPSPNPKRRGAARRASVDGGRTRYIRRPSQITKAKPTKRLRKRRAKNYDRPTKGRFPNPTARGFVICIKKGTGPKMHYDGTKFSQRPKYKVFPTQAAALKKARGFLSRYRVLRGYAVTVEPNF